MIVSGELYCQPVHLIIFANKNISARPHCTVLLSILNKNNSVIVSYDNEELTQIRHSTIDISNTRHLIPDF